MLCLQSYNRKLIGFDYNDDLLELSDKSRKIVSRAHSRFLRVFENRWKGLITNKISRLEKHRNTQVNIISDIEKNLDYKEGLYFLIQNTILNDLSTKLKQEKYKLEQVKN